MEDGLNVGPILKGPLKSQYFISFKDWGEKIGKKTVYRDHMWPATPQVFPLWLFRESLWALVLSTQLHVSQDHACLIHCWIWKTLPGA